jgi:DNA-directed RNA polymerase specialized sigma subunit
MDEFRTYLEQIGEFPDFREDPPRTSALLKRIKNGDQTATLSLMESALKYILALTASHSKRWSAWQNFSDLLQEANTEILETIENYDPAVGSLEAYIRRRSYFAFVRFWNKSKTVHVTDYGRKMLKNLQLASESLAASLQRQPTLEELSEHLDKDEPHVSEILARPGVIMIDLDSDEGQNGAGVINLDTLSSPECDPLKSIEVLELRELLVKCLKDKDADLLLAYYDSTTNFRELYLQLRAKEISPVAARKVKERLLKKLRKCLEARELLFNRGGVR